MLLLHLRPARQTSGARIRVDAVALRQYRCERTRKASCGWQTRATLAKRLRGLCKSSGVISCIASLPIDSLPTVSYWGTDVWATRRLGDRRLGDKFLWDDHLDDTGWTFGRQQLDVWTTGVETFGRQKWSVTPRTAAERGSCKRLSVSIVTSGCI